MRACAGPFLYLSPCRRRNVADHGVGSQSRAPQWMKRRPGVPGGGFGARSAFGRYSARVPSTGISRFTCVITPGKMLVC
jgi:hypothetical protein